MPESSHLGQERVVQNASVVMHGCLPEKMQMLEVVNGALCAGGGYGQSQVPECLQPHDHLDGRCSESEKLGAGFWLQKSLSCRERARARAGHGHWPDQLGACEE